MKVNLVALCAPHGIAFGIPRLDWHQQTITINHNSCLAYFILFAEIKCQNIPSVIIVIFIERVEIRDSTSSRQFMLINDSFKCVRCVPANILFQKWRSIEPIIMC